MAGRIAGYGLLTSGVDTGVATVNVRRLTTGKLLRDRPGTTTVGVEAFQSVDSLVLKSDGAVAWIATAQSIGSPSFIRQVELLDRRGFRRLELRARCGRELTHAAWVAALVDARSID